MKIFSLSLTIGGLAIKIRFPPELSFLNDDRFHPFRTAASRSDICWQYRLIPADSLTLPPLDPENDPCLSRVARLGAGSPLLRSPQVQACLEQAQDHAGRLTVEMRPDAVTILDFKSSLADFFIDTTFAAGLERHGIGPALLAPFLPRFSACLLHASALVRGGRAAVFLAVDEGGKTTAVRLSPAGTILSDDQVLVRRFHPRGGFSVFGTPWGLFSDSRGQAPLAGLFLLEKAGRFALTPLPSRDLVAHVWDESKNPLAVLPGPLRKEAFEIVCALARSVPAWRLAFPRDTIDWQEVDRALVSGG